MRGGLRSKTLDSTSHVKGGNIAPSFLIIIKKLSINFLSGQLLKMIQLIGVFSSFINELF